MSLIENCVYDDSDSKFFKYVNFIEPSDNYKSWYWHQMDLNIVDFLLYKFQGSSLFIGHTKPKQISGFLANNFPNCQFIGEVNASELSKRDYLVYKLLDNDIKKFLTLDDFGEAWDLFFIKQEASDDLLKSIELVGIDNIEHFMNAQSSLDAMINKVFYNNCTSLIFRKHQKHISKEFISKFGKNFTSDVIDFDYIAN